MKAAQMRVLVTGGSGGIGRALAVELHRRGAAVLLVGRDGAALGQALESMGGRSPRAEACVADLATAAGRAHVAATAASWGGPGINVLVNNAGLGEFGLLSQADDAAIERLFAINVIAPVLLTRALLGAAHSAARGRDPEHRFGVRQPRLSRLCGLLGHQVRAARLHRGPAPRAGRYAASACTTSRRGRHGPA